MNKRNAVLSVLDESQEREFIPAAFFIHYSWWCRRFVPAAVRKHLDFFRHTGMDLMKIQYERTFPKFRKIRRPEDWARMPFYSERFYAGQIETVRRLVGQVKREALVIMTVYSPFMCAGHTVGDEVLTEHLKENPDQVKKGLEIITESLLGFVKECIRIGVDGFYAASQGGERHRFSDSTLFEKYIKPFDLALMHEMERACQFNVLHICDYYGGYDDLSPFYDYPGHVLSCSLKRGDKRMSIQEISENFRRPFMGGMDNRESWISGTPARITRATEHCLDNAPDQFILGADCTLPNEVEWDTIRTAISAAHRRPTSLRRD